jgi:hypothetical protein
VSCAVGGPQFAKALVPTFRNRVRSTSVKGSICAACDQAI